ncbi:MAG TPA: CHASE domain-containing protein [Thermoanaerobaculia bacterium]|nr:CHASE domain-containing protein [Thermoanaerobaculia bacterium]
MKNLRLYWPAWLAAAVVLIATAAVAVYVERSVEATDRARNQRELDRLQLVTEEKMRMYTTLVASAAALFAARPDITREEFATFTARFRTEPDAYAGVLGVAFSRRLQQEEVEEFVASMRAGPFPDFAIRPSDPRAEVHAIQYIEPMNRRNAVAIGYDMFTHPVRRAAMERARDTGLPALSDRVTLVQEIEPRKQPGFLLYIPVYATGATIPPAVEERRRLLRGYAYAPFRAHDFFTAVLSRELRPGLWVSVTSPSGKPMYASHGGPHPDAYHELRRVQFTGTPWTLHVAVAPTGAPRFWSLLVAIAGVLLAALLFVLLRSLVTSRESAVTTTAAVREASEALRRLYDEADAANRAKSQFLATVSHELRTPMTAIFGWADLLLAGDLDDATRREAVLTIRRSARAQAQLIEDLLDISRIEVGKLHLHLAPVDLERVLAETVRAISPAAEAKEIALGVDVAPDPPLVHGDATRLQQILWNLLANAVKFTPRGGVVRASLRHEEGRVIAEVTDNGKGIHPAFLPFVFDRFRQEDATATRAHQGLGLGLSIVKHLTEMHGGEVSAHSEGEGRGASFRVSLPVRAAAVGEPQPARLLELRHGLDEADADGRALEGLRVMLVEDDDESRVVIASILQHHGASVTALSSVCEALGRIDTAFDLVLTDIGMPESDGYALLRGIRERGVTVPVVALTAYGSPDDTMRIAAAGFQGHLVKPVTRDHLIDTAAAAARGLTA